MDPIAHRSRWALPAACVLALVIGAARAQAQDAGAGTGTGTGTGTGAGTGTGMGQSSGATSLPSTEEIAANAVATETPSEEGDQSTDVDPGLRGDDDGDEEILPAPPPPISREEARAEEERRLDEEADRLPPPPPPEWRLRAGAGVGLPLNGANVPYLRLHQEVEWQPTAAAPFIFGLGGAEYLLGGVLGSAGARIGAATDFCSDTTVRCQAALNLVLGAFFGQNLLAFDFGGEGDVRFLFGPVELSVRVGFGGGGGINMLFGSGGIGGAF
jgi:hypothetical protein